ncbi:unnamed protein product [Psylliodes chrysocephalus]|uniref:Uncharacterized protein n=1 Tax=Psylliodes chrysocephalus TaxID=3402493 RepID=A0A9P0G541_9CUCU|nr:unnamed protein product [Psylliodes chrysocephala]
MKSFVPNDLHDVVRSAIYSPPFSVVNMEEFGFVDIQAAADSLNISKAVHVRIDSNKLGNVLTKETFGDFEQWKETCILKKGKKASDLKNTVIKLLPPENKITDNKKKSLTLMINFLKKKEHQDFYRKILNIE